MGRIDVGQAHALKIRCFRQDHVRVQTGLKERRVDVHHEFELIIAVRVLRGERLLPLPGGRARDHRVAGAQEVGLDGVLMSLERPLGQGDAVQEAPGIIADDVVPGGWPVGVVVHVEFVHLAFDDHPVDGALGLAASHPLTGGVSTLIPLDQFGIDGAARGIEVAGDDVQCHPQDGGYIAVVLMADAAHAPNQRRRLGRAEEVRQILDLSFFEARPVDRPFRGEVFEPVDRVGLFPPFAEACLELLPTDAAFLEGPVDIAPPGVAVRMVFQDVAQHEGEQIGVRSRTDRQPLVGLGRRVGERRIDDDDLRAGRLGPDRAPRFIVDARGRERVPSGVDDELGLVRIVVFQRAVGLANQNRAHDVRFHPFAAEHELRTMAARGVADGPVLGAMGRAETETQSPIGVPVGNVAGVHDDRFGPMLFLDAGKLVGDVGDRLVP